MDDLKNIIESLLFAADEPLTIDRLKKILIDAEAQAIREALDELRADYEARQGGFFLKEVAGGYQIRTRPDYKEYIRRLLQPRPQRLSKAALETLAIIAYKQPAIRSDVEHIRGVDCGGVLRVLLERQFIRVLGRKDIPGRPLIYATTKRFLEVFDLKNLKDLPTPKEIEEFGSALAEEMDTADREKPADEISNENSEETDPSSVPLEVEAEIPAESQQIAVEPDEAKPDQDA
ncbi:MAG: SMC-Scp complex subunit ScpB [Desulfobacteraceae bacterium]|jgi:segregation and condensation protein B